MRLRSQILPLISPGSKQMSRFGWTDSPIRRSLFFDVRVVLPFDYGVLPRNWTASPPILAVS
jgi:hypothetical protein